VLVVIRVALTLVGARTARCQARLQRIELRWGMGIGLASEDAHGAGACVRAIEAETNAADHVSDAPEVRARRQATTPGTIIVPKPADRPVDPG
jgi:hypothetical protein